MSESDPPWPPRAAGRPAAGALAAAGIGSPQALAHWRAADVLALHGVGPKAMRALAEDLAARGLSFFEG
jgi:predicted flap endonuclease-1-like 5' DNA nuclease